MPQINRLKLGTKKGGIKMDITTLLTDAATSLTGGAGIIAAAAISIVVVWKGISYINRAA